jgi:hypothetical protein
VDRLTSITQNSDQRGGAQAEEHKRRSTKGEKRMVGTRRLELLTSTVSR